MSNVKIVKDYIPKGRNNRPGFLMVPQFITIHDTGNTNTGADAVVHGRYLRGATANNMPVSWHFTVDDRIIVQHLPVDETGWHAGDGFNGPGNRTSIGIEICMNRDGDRTKAERNAAWLVAHLFKTIHFSLAFQDVMRQHFHWSGKNCPSVLRGRQNGWRDFLALCEAMIREEDLMFTDLEGHWAKAAIEQMAELGIIGGFPDGSFRPNEPVTRAQVAVLLQRLYILLK